MEGERPESALQLDFALSQQLVQSGVALLRCRIRSAERGLQLQNHHTIAWPPGNAKRKL